MDVMDEQRTGLLEELRAQKKGRLDLALAELTTLIYCYDPTYVLLEPEVVEPDDLATKTIEPEATDAAVDNGPGVVELPDSPTKVAVSPNGPGPAMVGTPPDTRRRSPTHPTTTCLPPSLSCARSPVCRSCRARPIRRFSTRFLSTWPIMSFRSRISLERSVMSSTIVAFTSQGPTYPSSCKVPLAGVLIHEARWCRTVRIWRQLSVKTSWR